MDLQEKMIWLFCYLSEIYQQDLKWSVQRFSPNQQQDFTDEEILTIYLFCVLTEQKRTIRSMHRFIRRYWLSWFPNLPSYAKFNNRLNRLAAVFPELLQHILQQADLQGVELDISVGDSMPIVLAKAKRSGNAKVAPEQAKKGYCASKDMYYYGVKLHVIAFREKGTLPLPEYLLLTPATEHDLTALRPILKQLRGRQLFFDKAYCDRKLAAFLRTQQATWLHTPEKKKKGQPHAKGGEAILATAVSRVRQPVEAFFSWMEEKTGIQQASKVRSYKGLLVHVFGRLAAAMCLRIFPFLKNE